MKHKKAKIKTLKKNSKAAQNPSWFDESCEKMKNEINRIGKQIKKEPKEGSHKQNLSKMKKDLKKTIKKNKVRYKNTLMRINVYFWNLCLTPKSPGNSG